MQQTFSLALMPVIAATLGALALSTPASAADPIADFYKGKQLQIVIRSAPGGSYDQYSRLLARHIGKHIPGNPTVIAINMPGGGGLLAINHVANIAPKDGTVLTIPDIGLGMYQATGFLGDSLKADLRQFNFIGNFSQSNMTVLTFHTSPVKTLEDAKKQQAILGTSGAASISAQIPAIYNGTLGTKFKLLLGFNGDQDLAMERGEIEGRAAITYASVKIGQPDWVKNKKLNFLLQVGLQKEKELPDVPLLIDLAQNQDQKDIFSFLSRVSALGRVLLAGPGVPAERVAALQKAFTATMNDPDFQSEAAKGNAELSPMDGETVRKLYLEKLNTDPAVLAKIRTAMEPRKEDQVEYQKK
jgi:tripartite-type tricarboxylate transporter receptor subunit TctC